MQETRFPKRNHLPALNVRNARSTAYALFSADAHCKGGFLLESLLAESRRDFEQQAFELVIRGLPLLPIAHLRYR